MAAAGDDKEAAGVSPPVYRLVAAGEEGELWIGGEGVAAGYINAPHLTVEVS